MDIKLPLCPRPMSRARSPTRPGSRCLMLCQAPGHPALLPRPPISGTAASAACCIRCKYRSVLATTAGGAAAFADVTTAGRPHLGAADEAQWRVRGATLMRLQQLGRTVRPGGHLVVLRAGGRLLRSGAAG